MQKRPDPKLKLVLLTIIFLIVNFTSFGQQSNIDDCYEVKYLDFFGLENQEVMKWPESEIKGLMVMDFKKVVPDSSVKTSFIIPLIMSQLKEYHPTCKSEVDSSYFNRIIALYFKIRGIEPSGILKKSLFEKIDYIRNDFYKQVENERYLPFMKFTMDDGPFYGTDFTSNIKLEPIATQQTEFGLLSISKVNKKPILTSQDKKGKLLWQKVITGLSDRKLSELHFTDASIANTSIATVVNLISEGERFTLYLRKDGKFMYYYHSW